MIVMPVSFTETPAYRVRGHRSQRSDVSSNEAKHRAQLLLASGRLSPLLAKVVETLAVAGVLTSAQLHQVAGVSLRTLRRYHYQHVLDRLYVTPTTLSAAGLAPDPIALRLYTLGAVGSALATLHQPARLLPSGYTGYGMHRITHEVLTNEVVIRLAHAAVSLGYEPLWHSKYEATVHDDAGRPVLEPDARLVLRRGTERHHYVVEYHNEAYGSRAEQKVRKYEATYRDGHWQRAWNTSEMPTVLVVWAHKAVGTGYREAVEAARARGLRCTYLGKPWQAVISGERPLQWLNFNTGKLVELLGEEVRE
jgi:hypothetical protein